MSYVLDDAIPVSLFGHDAIKRRQEHHPQVCQLLRRSRRCYGMGCRCACVFHMAIANLDPCECRKGTRLSDRLAFLFFVVPSAVARGYGLWQIEKIANQIFSEALCVPTDQSKDSARKGQLFFLFPSLSLPRCRDGRPRPSQFPWILVATPGSPSHSF